MGNSANYIQRKTKPVLATMGIFFRVAGILLFGILNLLRGLITKH